MRLQGTLLPQHFVRSIFEGEGVAGVGLVGASGSVPGFSVAASLPWGSSWDPGRAA